MRGAFADDDGVRIDKRAAVDVDGKVSRCEPCQHAVNAAQELVVRGARSDRFTHGKREQLADAKRSCQRKGRRAVGGDGVEIKRYPHANHG